MKILVSIILGVVCALNLSAQTTPKVNYFSLNQVELLESPFLTAQESDFDYLLALDADKLLAPFLREAGLEPKASSYTNWENSGLDGHIGGHYISAMAMMYAATGNAEIKRRLDYFIDELERCQAKVGTGFIGGTPGSIALWQEIKRGDIRAGAFDLNRKWVPLYNIHKTYNGLYDAYIHANSRKAFDILIKYTDWMIDITSGLTDYQMQDMLRSEHGGLNEIFASVAAITGDKKYLELAHRYSHRRILNPLLQEKDSLTGMHANTQIPKVIGFKRIADLENNESWDKASRFFWKTVTENRSVAIGGNSVREHFHPINDFSPMINDVQGPETCNTYNMLRLTKMLYETSPEVNFVDYYEKALYNHILSSVNPNHGGFVYFTPMRPAHYRVYSQPETSFWCCVGSGIENHTKYGEFIYAHNDNDLYINLFIPSRLTWKEKNVILSQTSNFPEDGKIEFVLEKVTRKNLTLKIRIPSWVSNKDDVKIKVNNKPYNLSVSAGNYAEIKRKWKKGDRVSLSLPMDVSLEKFPDNSNYRAFKYGPVLLAATAGKEDLRGLYADDSRGGHIAHGKQIPLQEIPTLLGTEAGIVHSLHKTDPDKLEFSYTGETFPLKTDLTLIPFYQLHDERYIIYFPQTEIDGLEAVKENYKNFQKNQQVEQNTLDLIYPGEQQPESDHLIKYENSETGNLNNRHFRKAEGWFSYEIKNREPASYITLIQRKDEKNESAIYINDKELSVKPVEETVDETFIRLIFPVTLESGRHSILIKPKNGTITSSIYEIRLMK